MAAKKITMRKKCDIAKDKKGAGYTFNLTINSLTAGEIMSIKHALEASGSPVAADVLAYLNNGVAEAPEDCKWLKDSLR